MRERKILGLLDQTFNYKLPMFSQTIMKGLHSTNSSIYHFLKPIRSNSHLYFLLLSDPLGIGLAAADTTPKDPIFKQIRGLVLNKKGIDTL